MLRPYTDDRGTFQRSACIDDHNDRMDVVGHDNKGIQFDGAKMLFDGAQTIGGNPAGVI